ncbi:MAG: hypothetical protein AABZ00_02840, partial [Chloroflexota bacterium]
FCQILLLSATTPPNPREPFYYWDTPSEMKKFMEDEWEDFEKLEEDVYKKTGSLWASANADARVRVRVKMLITKWISGKIDLEHFVEGI